MSPFVIFLIVLTIAYMLYYAAMITIDLTAKPNDDEAKEETLDTSDMDDGAGYTPKAVIENSDGGFKVHDFEAQNPGIEPENTIAEAEEEESEQQQAEQQTPEPQTLAEPEPEPEPIPKQEQDEQEEAIEKVKEEPAADETIEPPTEEEIEGIHTVKFVEDAPVTVREEVDKSDVPAFDPSLNPPAYDVSEVYGSPERDTSVARKANVVSTSLSSIETKGNQFDSFDLRNILADEEQTQQERIEVHHEATRM